jgi:antitoxin (DNA-binding transcriptional repressor) of toxin-antitoxin stability system
MIKLNINEVKTHLSRYLDLLAKGEKILLCKRNVPIAEIRPLPQERTSQRPIGLARGTFEVPPSFFEPLPDELTAAFRGEQALTHQSPQNPPNPLYQRGRNELASF